VSGNFFLIVTRFGSVGVGAKLSLDANMRGADVDVVVPKATEVVGAGGGAGAGGDAGIALLDVYIGVVLVVVVSSTKHIFL